MDREKEKAVRILKEDLEEIAQKGGNTAISLSFFFFLCRWLQSKDKKVRKESNKDKAKRDSKDKSDKERRIFVIYLFLLQISWKPLKILTKTGNPCILKKIII